MKNTFDLLVVIPVGPTCKEQFICDTIESVIFYTQDSYKIIISDDSQKQTGRKIKVLYPELDVVETAQRYGKNSGLYMSLCYAYRYALDNYSFKALLRLDTDALIIGHDPAREALALFELRPEIGLAGRHITGRFSPGTIGPPWDNRWIRKTLIKKAFSWVFFRRPVVNYRLRTILLAAFENGYELGECIFGGAYVFSEPGLRALYNAGLLPLKNFRYVGLEEDHLFSLLLRYVGLQLGDLASGNLPFGCAWVGLPASPEHLLLHGKKIIHSTRSWEGLNETAIRNFFKAQRAVACLN